jgi:DNA modification methylase
MIDLKIGDCRDELKKMAAESVHCCVTSPPYWGLRDYGEGDQIGLEATPEAYVEQMVNVFREVKRVLRGDGTLWLNLGDSYAGDKSGGRNDTSKMYGAESQHLAAKGNLKTSTPGLKPKDLVGIPWRVAFALQADGWYLRQDIIWAKPNPMPESVTDRCTKAHEYIFLLSKSPLYYYDADAIREASTGQGGAPANFARETKDHVIPGQSVAQHRADRTSTEDNGYRNKRSVWTVTTKPYKGAHFATFPPDLIKPCVLAGCPEGGIVLDPFGGAGTTGMVADRLGRNAVLIELNAEYAEMAHARLYDDSPLFAQFTQEETV